MPKDKLQDEFMELLNQCQGTIIKLCLLHTDRQPDSVNDLYQEIVCNLWESFPRFRHQSKPNTWVYRIALNTAYMQHRSRKHIPKFISLNDYMRENIANPEENNMINRLYQLIDLLDEYEKTIIFLYIDKVPLREIAETLGTTEDAIKHKISRLKLKMIKMNENEPQ